MTAYWFGRRDYSHGGKLDLQLGAFPIAVEPTAQSVRLAPSDL